MLFCNDENQSAGPVVDLTGNVKCSPNPIDVPTSGLAKDGIAMGRSELESVALA
jgi:hypothetical protein